MIASSTRSLSASVYDLIILVAPSTYCPCSGGSALWRWQQAGAQVLRTDEEGALHVQFSPGGLHWQRQRGVQRRYWY
jgi:hypothetical protein